MNFRNKYLVNTVRIVLGLLMVLSGIGGFYSHYTNAGVPPEMVAMTNTLWDTGIFQMIKVTEIVAGIMLLFGLWPALATLFLAPDAVGIVIVNARTYPSALPIGLIVVVMTAYLGYAYWEKYKAVFVRK